MKHKWQLGAALVLAAACIPEPARAQARRAGGVEIFGTAALHALWDDESFLGLGAAGGGGISVSLTDRLSLRGRVLRVRNERDFGNGVVFAADGTRHTADLIWHLSASPYAPYIGAGIGGFSYVRRSRFPDQSPGSVRSGTDTIVGGLAGFTVVSRGRFRLAPEASIWVSRPNNFIAIDVGLVASWRF